MFLSEEVPGRLPSKGRTHESRRSSSLVASHLNLFRISFIETNVYIPQDVPASSSSPQHMPSFHHRFNNKHLHGEW
jgi:hypothetical protein